MRPKRRIFYPISACFEAKIQRKSFFVKNIQKAITFFDNGKILPQNSYDMHLWRVFCKNFYFFSKST
jgi:hypothetical protein